MSIDLTLAAAGIENALDFLLQMFEILIVFMLVLEFFLDFFSPMFEISIVVYGLYWKCYNYVEIYQLWLINFFIISKLLK